MIVNDVDRTYLVRLPKGYDRAQKYPVVILLHGMNQEPDDMERLTRFDELADKAAIITVYPSALHGRWNVECVRHRYNQLRDLRWDVAATTAEEAGEVGIPGAVEDIRAVANRGDSGAVKYKINLHRRMTLVS